MTMTQQDRERELVINSAAKEYDGSALARSLCGRQAYINEALREKALPPIDKGEGRRLSVNQRGGAAERARAIADAVKEYNAADERLRGAWKVADVVNGALFAAGMEPLSDEERAELEAGRVPGA